MLLLQRRRGSLLASFLMHRRRVVAADPLGLFEGTCKSVWQIRELKTGLATLASCQVYNLMRPTMGWQRPKYMILLLLAPEMINATWLVNTLTSPDKEAHHAVAIKKAW